MIGRLAAAALLVAAPAWGDGALTTMDQVSAALGACWSAPADGPRGSITLSFALTRGGALLGPPQVAGGEGLLDAAAVRALADAAASALRRCTPLTLAPALGEAIAGQVFTMRFDEGR